MTPTALVTYATRTGWTVGVAEAIGKALAETQLERHSLVGAATPSVAVPMTLAHSAETETDCHANF